MTTAKEIRDGKMVLENQRRANLNKAQIASAERQAELNKVKEEAQQVVAESVKANESKIVAGRYQKENKSTHQQVENFAKPGHTKVG
jgi:hypothetical protein